MLPLVQVCKRFSLNAKSSNNVNTLLFPCPKVLLCLAFDCARVIGNLLILSGDIETNPGPGSTKAELEVQVKQLDSMHELMRKLDTNVTGLATGQAALKADVEAMLGKQAHLETSVAAVNAKLVSFEKEIVLITQARADVLICNIPLLYTPLKLKLCYLDLMILKTARDGVILYFMAYPMLPLSHGLYSNKEF